MKQEKRETNWENVLCVCVCIERERERERSSRVWCTQWQSQDFSLKRAKLKDNIKSEINLKNINQ